MNTIYQFTDEEILLHHSIDKRPNPEDFPMHAHDMCEIFYFMSGNSRYMVEGSEYPLEPGSLMLMRPAETHKLQIQADSPYERYAIHFSPGILKHADPQGKLLEAFFDRPLGQQNLYPRSSFRSGYVHECLNDMKTMSSDDYDRKLAILSYLFPILQEIRSAFLQKKQEAIPDVSHDVSKELVKYINYNLSSNELSLDMLSKHFLISKCQLNRIFKQATGSTIWDYVLIKRMMAARQMLIAGKPAYEACQACGFRDYSAFYRLYKKRFHVTPQKDSGRKK
ncbi:MAG: AraC family transcriptional regulator [Oscillospiraceae bacterium]|nr:AraC family transcriptional regulator [Oscillospiraceae bacterium]MDD4414522.1 AraC family transcriptional regulator [Oscillospiraceae bacterium]